MINPTSKKNDVFKFYHIYLVYIDYSMAPGGLVQPNVIIWNLLYTINRIDNKYY